MTNAYVQYQRMQAETAPPGELVLMMYNGAIRFLNLAKKKIEAKDIGGANDALLRAQEIVLELMVSVDVATGPVARNLFDLYEFMHRHLVQANVRKDIGMVDDVIGLLKGLLPAWEQAIAGTRVAAVRAGAAA
jgi:flagellar protein FliS